ncbi:MAG: sporulation integral membrane protein YlbJ [Firmicutes bacterium]|nr:sporulation integral membrane protein YlbJ [Bacillota bacterium]
MTITRKRRLAFYMFALIGFTLTFSMVLFPENAFQAAVRGLDVWWNVVFPALLPFFIAAEILMGLGVVHFMGVMLEPLMRPLFRVPGSGAFVMSVGLASGFPIGAILTAKLRSQNMISKEEGERLMSFTNTADPLFMFGAVAVGMLAYPQIGYTIAVAHYLSSISVGLLMRFHKPSAAPSSAPGSKRQFILIRAAKSLVEARTKEQRPFGKLMGDAVRNSVSSLLLVGGFIISFSVVIEILNASGIVAWIAEIFAVSSDYLLLITNGILEITLGCQVASQSSLAMTHKIMAVSGVIAWSGLSVHGQVASIISGTDLDIKPYLVARAIHATLAAVYTLLLFQFDLVPALDASVPIYATLELGQRYLLSASVLGRVMTGWVLLAVGVGLFQAISRLRLSIFKVKSGL